MNIYFSLPRLNYFKFKDYLIHGSDQDPLTLYFWEHTTTHTTLNIQYVQNIYTHFLIKFSGNVCPDLWQVLCIDKPSNARHCQINIMFLTQSTLAYCPSPHFHFWLVNEMLCGCQLSVLDYLSSSCTHASTAHKTYQNEPYIHLKNTTWWLINPTPCFTVKD